MAKPDSSTVALAISALAAAVAGACAFSRVAANADAVAIPCPGAELAGAELAGAGALDAD